MDLWISSLDFECAASPRFLSSLNGGGGGRRICSFFASFISMLAGEPDWFSGVCAQHVGKTA